MIVQSCEMYGSPLQSACLPKCQQLLQILDPELVTLPSPLASVGVWKGTVKASCFLLMDQMQIIHMSLKALKFYLKLRNNYFS